MRIGVVSDTHVGGDGRGLPAQLLRALDDIDIILHCGDLDSLGVLDCLSELAPVRAVRSYDDPFEEGERLVGPVRAVEAEGVRVGMIHDIQWPGPTIGLTSDQRGLRFPKDTPLSELLARKFGAPVDVVAFGDTHEELVLEREGVLFINPGSPTFPGLRHGRGELGTIALMEVVDRRVRVELVKLEGSRQS